MFHQNPSSLSTMKNSRKFIIFESYLPLSDQIWDGREWAAYTLPSAMLATELKAVASSVELLSVSGLAAAETSKEAAPAGIGIVSLLPCISGTLDKDLARCLSLETSVPGSDLRRRNPVVLVTTSELLLVEKVLVRGLCDPLALLGLAPISVTLRAQNATMNIITGITA